MTELNDLIERLKLKPHPEGGYYNECYRSEQRVVQSGHERRSCTHIYYALAGGQHSAWHRVHSDEIWNFYAGVDLELHCLSPDCSEHQIFKLGAGKEYAAVIPANYWQAARSCSPDTDTANSEDRYTLVGCSVAPGFEFSDFMMLRDHPRKEHLADELRALL